MVMLNVFELDLNQIKIPQEAYIYKVHLKTVEQKKRNMCAYVLGNSFGYFNRNTSTLYSYKGIEGLPRKIKKYCDVEFLEKVRIDEIDENIRDVLVRVFIRQTIKRDIKRILGRQSRRIGRWIISLDLERIELIEHDGKILVSFNIKLNINANINLWDLIGRDVNRFRRLCWYPEDPKDVKIWFKSIPHLILREIENSDEDAKSFILSEVYMEREVEGWTFEDLREYPKTEFSLTEDDLRKFGNYTQFDSNQPIIKGITLNGGEYYFLPQYCIPAYSPMLATADEKEKIEKIKNKLKNNKDRIIKKIVEKLPYLKLSNVEVKKVEDTANLKAKFVDVELLEGKVTNIFSQPYEMPISNTSDLFGWISKIMSKKDGVVEVCIPDYIPEFLTQIPELELFLLIERDLSLIEIKIIDRLLNNTIKIYNTIRSVCIKCGMSIPFLNYRGKRFYFENSREGIREVCNKITDTFNSEIGFALIFGKRRSYEEEEDDEETFDYYIPLKSALFKNGILSQNFDVGRYIKGDCEIDWNTIRYAISNIVYDIFGKLGIKFFVLEENVPYDYILGIDIGFGEAYTGKVAGCTTVHDSEGRLRNLIPIEKQNYPSKETARIKALLEEVEQKRRIYEIDFRNKTILIIRDGGIKKEEIKQLMEFTKERNCKITYIEVRKGIAHQFLVKDSNVYYAELGNYYILKTHNPRTGFPRPVKIARKIVIDGNGWKELAPTEDDVLLIYKLTSLNYSTIGKDSNLRVPAPIYYADKLVKALKRGWQFDERFLKYGILYFL